MASQNPWFTRTVKDTLKALKSSKNGVTELEAEKRLEKYGPNKLKEVPKPSALIRFISQFGSAPVLMLIGAIIILVLLAVFAGQENWTDAAVIFIVIFLNATMGYIQESKAEAALEALKKLTAPKVKVRRKGKVKVMDATLVVPGDILSLGEGDKVPADARIIEEIALEVDEAILTGESVPVRKDVRPIKDKKVILADRLNMVFTGTIVTRGRGYAVVTATGMRTEIGKIAGSIQKVEEKTPLEKKLDHLGKQIGLIAVAACIVLFIIRELVAPGNIYESFLLSVSLAVAIIPEGLPIVMLVTLAVGMQIMAKRNAIIRKLPAVEALGSTTVICTDKTGTLTRNQMTVREMWVGGRWITVKGSGYKPKGKLLSDGKEVDIEAPAMVQALRTMVLCNDSNLVQKEGRWSVIGDPTEGALLVVGGKAGMRPQDMYRQLPRSGEKVFDSDRKMMTTIHAESGRLVAYMKGAPEVLADLAKEVFDGDEVVAMTPERKEKVLKINKLLADKAYRVLALGVKRLRGDEVIESKEFERDLILIGMVGIIDPVREDARDAIAQAQRAGVSIVMITGDQKATAKAVGKELGIMGKKGKLMTGVELEAMDDDDFLEVVKDISIYARVSPEHKTRIVSALKEKGEIVAMTGDGVNDAPALKNAHIGISMGISGTDVAREASDMVLTDDNFKSIVAAVEEGRRVYDNIRKFIRYQLSTNIGALFLLFVATITLPVAIPMYPVQVLWVNIMMDGPPAVALGLEPMNRHLMSRRPRNPKESILSKKVLRGIGYNGIFMGLAAVLLFWWGLENHPGDIARAQTLTFTGFVMFQMFNVFNCRSFHRSSFSISLSGNRFLAFAVALSVLLQLLVVYSPLGQYLFKTVALDWMDWLLIAGLGLCVLFLEEAKKLWLKSGETGW